MLSDVVKFIRADADNEGSANSTALFVKYGSNDIAGHVIRGIGVIYSVRCSARPAAKCATSRSTMRARQNASAMLARISRIATSRSGIR